MSTITAPFEAIAVRALSRETQTRLKEWKELRYWKKRHAQEINLSNGHYRYFYTTCFGLGLGDYAGRRLLDVGCGPRGSLEWATTAAELVGVDPLAERYKALHARRHRMKYVNAYAEAMPLEDASFDDAFCFNALDQTADYRRALGEIHRVLKPGGRFLLITEVNHAPTLAEPNCILPGELAAFLESRFAFASRGLYRVRGDHDIYKSVRDALICDAETLPYGTPAIFTAHCVRKA